MSVVKPNWPEEMHSFLRAHFGEATGLERLQGVAGSGATHVRFPGTSLVVKSSGAARERRFYELVAVHLRKAGVTLPTLYWSGTDGHGMNWLVLEYIPHSYPQNRWIGDVAQLEALACLHAATWGDDRFSLEDLYCPTWDDALTEHACAWFDRGTAGAEVRSRLVEVQYRCQQLFAPKCGLSGDPNPTNWRMRDDGSLVLIDWERFCLGHPAIDLAITIPGFGSDDGSVERNMAYHYIQALEAVQHCPLTAEELAVDIRLEKIWSVVEFIANADQMPTSYPQETVMFIVNRLPNVLQNLPL